MISIRGTFAKVPLKPLKTLTRLHIVCRRVSAISPFLRFGQQKRLDQRMMQEVYATMQIIYFFKNFLFCEKLP